MLTAAGRATALLAVAMTVAACADSDAVVIRSVEDDVCPVVAVDEVADIYGVAAVELEEVRFDFSLPTCLVTPQDHETVLIGWEAVRSYEQLRNTPNPLLMNEPIDVDGIGERAFVVVSDALEDDQVNVHFEVDGVTVSIYGLPGADPLDPTAEVRAVAASVAERIRFAGVASER